ncbi:RecX family transcriptional regulator [Adhaeribacter arboris]|uniref:Regulatory protein RecX n=1 Tax=Adhaeribacter arboris TaxID=2072846 RepID=A0A2T2YPA1_9BACT|nr:regulatory protein RecX [Adhaeribacter arboris]PSR57342.1 RecX family transcriptional regulator [Adhaeribacter arboris]
MQEPRKKKTYTVKEALIKAAAYCAYQERTQQEVRNKLYSYGLDFEEVEETIIRLCAEKLIDEERFAKAYVRGKYSLKRWGRRKILLGLKAHQISDYCIRQGMKEIDLDTYWQNLLYLTEKKNRTEKESNPAIRKHKLTQFLLSKGYENDLIQDALQEVSKEKQ